MSEKKPVWDTLMIPQGMVTLQLGPSKYAPQRTFLIKVAGQEVVRTFVSDAIAADLEQWMSGLRVENYPEIEELRKFAEAHEFKGNTLRIEKADFDGEHGCRFIVGDADGADHVVAEWRGDGIHADTIYTEEPVLNYGHTTTPFQRCIRMALELVHWPVTSALLAGPGDGALATIAERLEEGDIVLPRPDDGDEYTQDFDEMLTLLKVAYEHINEQRTTRGVHPHLEEWMERAKPLMKGRS